MPTGISTKIVYLKFHWINHSNFEQRVTLAFGSSKITVYELRALSWQIVTICMIQTPRETSTQSKPRIEELADFIGQILANPANQVVGFRIFQIVTICRVKGP